VANKDPINELAGATKELKAINKEIKDLESGLKRVNGLVGTSLGSVKSLLSSGVGQGTSMGLGVSNASFGGANGGNVGSVMPWTASKRGALGLGIVQGALGAGAIQYAGLPDLGTVMARPIGFYNATRRMPGVSREQLTAASFGAIKGGITGPGEDVAAANVLTLGYNMGSGQNFLQSMREVKGAALGYNMPNATAAMAIGGMHTGDMSANLYQYGISTLNVKTGKVRTMDDIASQIYRKVYGSKKLTVAQQEFSLREGSLNRVVNDLGFSQAQQEILRPMLSQISQGQVPSLLNETGANNPAKSLYEKNTSDAKLADKVTADYIEGYKKATAAVIEFNSYLEKTPGWMLQLKAAIDGVQGTSVGKSTNTASTVIKTVAGTVGTYFAFKGLKSLFAAKSAVPAIEALGKDVGTSTGLLDMYGKPIAGTATTTAAKTAGSVAKGLAKKAGLGALTYGALETLQGVLNKASVPDWLRTAGNTVFDTGEGALTAFAATGNPFVAIGGAGAGLATSMAKPVKPLPSVIKGNDTEQQWATDVLTKIGVPVTAANIDAVTTWMRFEGGGGGKATGLGKNSANWNPLNTTQGAPGATAMNSVGVKSYLSRDQGLQATVSTLQNGK
jgi:hypothetical protein